MNTVSNKDKLFYGWVIVAGGIFVMATVIGIGWNCFSQFIKPVCADMGFSRQAMSANMTLLSFAQFFLNLAWGQLIKKVSVKKLLRVAAIANPVAYFCYSFAQNIWMFYACSLVIGITMNMLTILAFSLILSNWFHEKRGTAIGITFMGTGLGGAISPTLNGAVFDKLGSYNPAFMLWVCLLVIAFCIYFTILPKDKERASK